MTENSLCTSTYRDRFWCRKYFSCLSKNDTNKIVSSIFEPGIGIISCIYPRKNSSKLIFKWNDICLDELEGCQKYAKKESDPKKKFSEFRYSVIMACECFDHGNDSNGKAIYTLLLYSRSGNNQKNTVLWVILGWQCL